MTPKRLLVLVACLAVTACAAVASNPVALPGYHWQLSEAVDSDHHRLDDLLDPAEKPLQLDFSANALSVRNACNGIHGNYRVTNDHLVVELLAQTMMACAQPALMQRETAIKQILRGKPLLTLSSSGGHVQLTLAAEGQSLTFVGVPVGDDH